MNVRNVICVLFFTEDDGEGSPCEQKLSKRDIHTLNEQRRRDLIKVHRTISTVSHYNDNNSVMLNALVGHFNSQIGYEQLTELVPTCRPTSGGVKPSRAVILQRS